MSFHLFTVLAGPSDRNASGLGPPVAVDVDGDGPADVGDAVARAAPEGERVQMQVFQEEVDDDEEEEEVETVEDSAPEDEGDPPPGKLLPFFLILAYKAKLDR